MIRVERHPLVRHDLHALARHVLEISGDPAAAERRLDQVDALLAEILANPTCGPHLGPALPGWRVRHGGPDRRITVVFRLNEPGDCLQIILVAFGGQNWMGSAPERAQAFPGG